MATSSAFLVLLLLTPLEAIRMRVEESKPPPGPKETFRNEKEALQKVMEKNKDAFAKARATATGELAKSTQAFEASYQDLLNKHQDLVMRPSEDLNKGIQKYQDRLEESKTALAAAQKDVEEKPQKDYEEAKMHYQEVLDEKTQAFNKAQKALDKKQKHYKAAKDSPPGIFSSDPKAEDLKPKLKRIQQEWRVARRELRKAQADAAELPDAEREASEVLASNALKEAQEDVMQKSYDAVMGPGKEFQKSVKRNANHLDKSQKRLAAAQQDRIQKSTEAFTAPWAALAKAEEEKVAKLKDLQEAQARGPKKKAKAAENLEKMKKQPKSL